MELIKFTNGSKTYEVSLFYVNENVMRIKFNEDPVPSELTTGFELLNEYNYTVMASYSDYITIYRTYEEDPRTIELSNDESVYVPPEPEPEPEPPEPTLEELQAAKIAEISSVCESTIANGLIYKENQYGYSSYDQLNIRSKMEMAVQTLNSVYIPSGNGNQLLTADEIKELYTQLEIFAAQNKAYATQLILVVQNEIDKENVKNIYYGQELTGDYKTSYDAEMEVQQTAIEGYVNQLRYAQAKEVEELKNDLISLNKILGRIRK